MTTTTAEIRHSIEIDGDRYHAYNGDGYYLFTCASHVEAVRILRERGFTVAA